MPGPGFAGVPYPPPPGWFPPGQGFPPGPAPWNNAQFPGGPGGPQGPSGPQRGPPSGPAQGTKSGPAAEQAKASAAVPTEPKSLAHGGRQPANAPNPPVDSKPSVEEVKAVATNLSNGSGATKNRANNRPTPVVPLTGSTAKPFQLPNAGKPASASAKAPSAAAPTSVEDATNAARAAVAVAMAQLGNSGTTAMDNLTNKVNEMRVNASNASRGTGISGGRGRGRGGRQGAPKVEVPDSDFDFAQSNAKFNREEIAKEAIASGDLVESPNEPVVQEPEVQPASSDPAAGTYNKSRSFFDNISSESRERAENGGQKPGGREWRGEEQRKNMETFGQGSVDGGYRNYRGRGRGRGGRGRGGFNRGGGRGGNRPQYQTATADQ